MSSANFLFSAPFAASASYKEIKPNFTKKNISSGKDSSSWSEKTVSNGSRTYCMKKLRITKHSFERHKFFSNVPNFDMTRSDRLQWGDSTRAFGQLDWAKQRPISATWNPINNKKFETLSYLPPLSEESIAKEIDYMIKKQWIPCLEFDEVGYVYRENSRMPNYYDGRYWTLWKLPMFGCNDSSQVLNEIQECKKAYPNAYIRCLAFDNMKQGQCMAFLIQKPNDAPPH
ncbi:ribulose bisphosphate carboxylase small chain chloroplastic [Phtheirospermum japonicum]|uniref:Ribulose bisphosphate carboxylase small subunit, chloroplastic n=1 Tax=Phtheirospermum japonicum TaxID=374723 RepID=A0A830CGH2_9LAMI|nr:ribulose bisphosphate carboxylase small chain chloroplastic [Phtheirospermum japonicum]